MKTLFFIILLYIATLSPRSITRYQEQTPEQPKTSLEHQHATTHRIFFKGIFEDDNPHSCSATQVGPHALLTAGHCEVNSNEIFIYPDKKATKILATIPDGNDHVIYIVDKTFSDYSPIEERALIPQEPVHMWGNPLHENDAWRDGFFREITTVPDFIGDTPVNEFILPCYGGDSGAAIFDASGHIVSVVTGGLGIVEDSPFLSFTPAQIKVALVN